MRSSYLILANKFNRCFALTNGQNLQSVSQSDTGTQHVYIAWVKDSWQENKNLVGGEVIWLLEA